MDNFVVVVDSGADMPDDVVDKYNIEVIPFHFSIDGIPFDDGDITTEDLFARCRVRGVLPFTSASSPHDYSRAFEGIHCANPNAHIIYLGYSAATTSSFSSAEFAASGKDWVTCIDTKSASGSYGLIAEKTCEYLKAFPNATIKDVKEYVSSLIGRARLVFIPSDLAFLHAGGRLSAAGKLVAQVLNIKPAITMEDGRLEIAKLMKGSMRRCAEKTLSALFKEQEDKLEAFRLIRSTGLAEKVEHTAEQMCERFGVNNEGWVETGCVVSSHCGPATFGYAAIFKN